MGDIVKRWITEKLGLDAPPANDPPAFRVEAANGILIAEILRKYGLLSDDEFVSLSHANNKKSRHTNMQHLHNWLTKAGMDIQPILLVDMAEEKSGSAVKFLYELFLWLENGPRKPKVGDKARKYLTTSKIGPGWNNEMPTESPFAEYTPKTILSKDNSKWSRAGKPPGTNETDTTTKKQNIFKKSNWYSSLDKILAPPLIVQMEPFAELSEAAQAEALYFAKESLQTLEIQNQIYNYTQFNLHDPTRRPFHEYKSVIRPDKYISPTNFKLKARDDEIKSAIEDIRKFDRRLKENRKRNTKPRAKDLVFNDKDIVYRNGKGSAIQLQKSLQALKQRRRKEMTLLEKLTKCRKATAHRILDHFPSLMEKDLQDKVMKNISRLPFSERMLADFIYNSHLEKISFKQHVCYEVRQKQTANDFDLAKELQIAKQQDDLKKSVLEHRTRQPSQRIDDDLLKLELEESANAEKAAMVHDLLGNLVNVVVDVADYRSAMGNASFGTDLFREAVEAGSGIETKIVLQRDKFVMEPVQSFDIDIDHHALTIPPHRIPVSPNPKDDGCFLIHHIATLLDRFLQIANGSSLVPMKAFTFIIEDLILASKRSGQGEFAESLPPVWLRLSPVEIKKLVYLLMGKRGFINWRNFLIACLDISFPDQNEIISTLSQFRQLDPASLFLVDKNKFDRISLWFEPKPPCVLSEAFHALHLRECIFFMFADKSGYFYYIDFLLYFCKDAYPAMGIAKALAVLTGRIFSTKEFERKYFDTSAVLLTDSELELMFEKIRLPATQDKRYSLVPPNTPLPLRKPRKTKHKLGFHHQRDDGEGEKNRKRKSRQSVKATKMQDISKSVEQKEISFAGMEPFQESNQKISNIPQVPEKKENLTPDKQYSFPGRFPEKGKQRSFVGSAQQDDTQSDVSKLSERSAQNSVPAEAFLQALWFGHVTSYPVEDLSFISVEYLKIKQFIDLVYNELYEDHLARLEDGVYSALLHQLLAHPFVTEVIKRFITYKHVSMADTLKDVLPTSASDFDLDNMESPPTTASGDKFDGKDQFLSDVDSAAEFDGANTTAVTDVPSSANLLTGSFTTGPETSLLNSSDFVVEPGSVANGGGQPAGSVSAPNAVSASLEARTSRVARRTKSTNPSANIKPKP